MKILREVNKGRKQIQSALMFDIKCTTLYDFEGPGQNHQAV
jgi:hypothetical protein